MWLDVFKTQSWYRSLRFIVTIVLVLFSLLLTSWMSAHVPMAHITQDVGLILGIPRVQFDSYSLILDGRRVFLHSGEFHTFRLPIPSLWPDILQKAKAAGLNSLSVYIHMGLVNPSPGVVDFDGFRSLELLFTAAKKAGLFIILRPGPYINAETSAGGIAHWTTSRVAGRLRSNATDWHAAWQGYIQGVIRMTSPYQLDYGGPVIAIQIDNEYWQDYPGNREYFAELQEVYRKSGILVPLTYNDPGMGRNFINGTGAVDLYGFDSYPQLFDCSHPNNWKPVVTNYHTYHKEVNPSQPFYIPEFQAGSYDAWGPTAPGYPSCSILTGPDFQSVFNLQLWASNAKMINYYMFYGGTSWGALPFHGVYSSYDYGAPVSETRELTTKYDELKRQGMFLRSSPEFYKTDWIGENVVPASSEACFFTLLRNPDTEAGFYIVRQNDSSSTAITNFKINITTTAGSLRVPLVASSIQLNGRQSKVIVTDYSFGGSKVVYSTAQVFYAGIIGGRDVLFLYGDSDQEHELALFFTGTPNQVQTSGLADSFIISSAVDGFSVINILQKNHGLVTIYDSDTQLILFADSVTAATFWAPVIPGAHTNPFNTYWDLGTNQSVLIGGPYLVRSVDLTGSHLSLTGDLKSEAQLTIIAPKEVRSISWNGEQLSSDTASLTVLGGFVARLSPKSIAVTSRKIPVPALDGWKYKDSLPEIQKDYDDSRWTVADKTTTNIPFKPYYGDGRVLYGCDYEFCENVVLWRGHFTANGVEKSVNLSINGGEAFAASVWINDVFLKTSYGNSTNNQNILEETDDQFFFPPGSITSGEDNVITIVQDNMGLNETGSSTDQIKSPRGIRGFQLNTGTFSTWKVQGKVGGYTNYLDKVRGVFNEGGLYGERKGWHLPGFNTSDWVFRDLKHGLPDSKAGIGFFVTTFTLNIPLGLDVPMVFNFSEPFGQHYRAVLFVNGWMMGKRVGNLGPQSEFPVSEGILDYRGINTVAVALWAMTPGVTISPDLRLMVKNVYEGGIGEVVANNPSWVSTGRE